MDSGTRGGNTSDTSRFVECEAKFKERFYCSNRNDKFLFLRYGQ